MSEGYTTAAEPAGIDYNRIIIGGCLVLSGVILLMLSIYLFEIAGGVAVTAALLGA
jgi:hypothetical protein